MLRAISICPGLLCALSLAMSSVATAEEPAPAKTSSGGACARRAAQKIQERYEAIRDLEADFEQETRSVMLGSSPMGSGAPVRGHVVFAKPGRMRWSYTEPTPSLLVSDGSVLWLYDPTAREASRLAVDEGYLSGAALQFLMGDGKLLDEFELSSPGCSEDPKDGLLRLELVPRKPASYERMSLVADASTGDLKETTIVDLFGNATRVALRDVKTNRRPADSVFHFDPPEGVSVVDLLTTP